MNPLAPIPAPYRLLALAVLAVLALAGCANGVTMTDEETIACRNTGCSAWTEMDLRRLIGKVFKDGYLEGWTDSNKQAGRNL